MNFSQQRKGQSAIEYLTTYGWMLLVVAIVGGAVFTLVQGQSNVNSVSGFSGSDVGIESFGTTSSGLALEMVATGSDPVNITEVTVTNPDTGDSVTASTNTGLINLGESSQVTVSGISSSDTSTTFNIEVVYDTGSLTGIQETGTLTGNFEITN